MYKSRFCTLCDFTSGVLGGDRRRSLAASGTYTCCVYVCRHDTVCLHNVNCYILYIVEY
jgi:hypothetical protein